MLNTQKIINQLKNYTSNFSLYRDGIGVGPVSFRLSNLLENFKSVGAVSASIVYALSNLPQAQAIDESQTFSLNDNIYQFKVDNVYPNNKGDMVFSCVFDNFNDACDFVKGDVRNAVWVTVKEWSDFPAYFVKGINNSVNNTAEQCFIDFVDDCVKKEQGSEAQNTLVLISVGLFATLAMGSTIGTAVYRSCRNRHHNNEEATALNPQP